MSYPFKFEWTLRTTGLAFFNAPLPIKWLPYHVDVNNIFCFVIGQLVQVDEGEVAVINCRKSILPSRHVVGKKQLITKRH